MPSPGKKIDRLIRFDRLRTASIGFVIGILIVGVFAYIKLPPAGNSSTVTGVVTGLRSIEGDGVRLFLEVRLRGGAEVLVKIPYTGHYYRKGKVVSLNKRKSKVVGGAKYHFQNDVAQET